MHEWMKLSRRFYIQLPGIFHTILTLGWLAFHSRTLLADDDLAALLKWFKSVFNRIFEAGIQDSLSFMNSMSFLCNSSLENELVLDLKSDPGRALMPGSGFWESWLSGRLARFFKGDAYWIFSMMCIILLTMSPLPRNFSDVRTLTRRMRSKWTVRRTAPAVKVSLRVIRV